MSLKYNILIGLLIVSLTLTAFSGPFQAAGQKNSVPWWVIVLVLLAPLLGWWLLRRPEEEAIPTAEAEAGAPARVADTPTPDDLTHIEGIGPKISGLLQAAGIMTFAQLAATNASQLDQIVKEAGITLADASTWPEQARLAAAGEWVALEALQDELKGGRRV